MAWLYTYDMDSVHNWEPSSIEYNNNGDRHSPWANPTFWVTLLLRHSAVVICTKFSRMIGQMALITLPGNPTSFSLHSMIDRLTLSNAFLKSTNMTYNGVLGVAKASDTY